MRSPAHALSRTGDLCAKRSKCVLRAARTITVRQKCLQTRKDRPALRLQFGVPIEEIHPAVVQVIGWKFAPHIPQLFSGGRPRRLAQMKPALAQAF